MSGRIGRRGLLAGAAGSLGVAALPGAFACGTGSDSNRRPGRAAVVGAGLAGLACAFELERLGWKVTVLEARERVGGRVWTSRDPFAEGQHGELGGEYIDASHTVLRDYASRFELDLEDVRLGPDLDSVAHLGGRRALLDDLVTGHVEADIERYYEALEELAGEVDPANPIETGSELDARSAADLLDELDLDPLARSIVERAEIVDEFTVEPERLSLLFLAAVSALGAEDSDDDVEAFRIAGGNDRLPSALEAELRDVRLGVPVEQISADDEMVVVTHSDGVERADHCVIAVPLPALRAIDFDVPDLPPALVRALDAVQYGAGTKTLLQYSERVWREDDLSGDSLTDLPIGSTWEATDRQQGEAGILLAYTVGERGKALGELSAAARVGVAARDAEIVFPGTRDELGATATAAWHAEEFTGGTYVAWAPGQMSEHWETLRRPHGRLHLAGEHTDAYATYMEGALRSGRRIAKRLSS